MKTYFKCAWCGKETKPPVDDGNPDRKEETSHGLCRIECYYEWLEKQIKEEISNDGFYSELF